MSQTTPGVFDLYVEGRKYYGFWYVPPCLHQLPPGRANYDWLCAGWINPDGTAEIRCRFHYVTTGETRKIGEKVWFGGVRKFDGPIETEFKACNEMASFNAVRNTREARFLALDLCSGEETLKKLLEQPWIVAIDDGFDTRDPAE